MARRKKIEASEEMSEDAPGTPVETNPDLENSQTLDSYVPKPRPYMDRMLKPQRGMDLKPWGGRDHWICPRCKRSTFSASEASNHRC